MAILIIPARESYETLVPMVTIRPATEGDLAAVIRVAREGWHNAYGAVLSRSAIDETLNRWYSEDAMKRRLSPGLVVAVSSENQVVGYAQHGRATDSVYELSAIYVLPEVLGQGAGWELWKAVRQAARESGQPWIELWVLERNSLGRRWYDRQGGQIVGSREIELGSETHRELRYRFSAA
jgi:ribosomal protein S18 acetylase RimI-like enzyme